jgi:hypothetical protein
MPIVATLACYRRRDGRRLALPTDRTPAHRAFDDAPLEREGRLADLGLGGAQIRADHPPPMDVRLRITLSAPSAWDPLDLPAVVRWVDDLAVEGPVFGVAFTELSESQAEALYQLLSVSRFAEPRA